MNREHWMKIALNILRDEDIENENACAEAFAAALEKAYDAGWDDGHDVGVDDGYRSAVDRD